MKTQLFSWSAFGKISVIIITAWTIIQVIDWISKDTGKLSATVEISDYILPYEIQNTLSYKQLFTNAEDLADSIVLKTQLDFSKKGDSLSYVMKLFTLIDNFLKNRLSSDFFAFSRDYKLIELQITNPSKKLINSINIDFDHYGIYQFIDQNNILTFGTFDYNLSLGNLRALNTSSLIIWTTGWIEANDIKINYDGGVTQPSEIIKVDGFYAWLGKYPIYYNIFVRLIPFTYLCFLIYLLIKYIIRRKSKDKESEVLEKKIV